MRTAGGVVRPPLLAQVEVADLGVRDPCVLPAVAAVAAGGFLSVALPVIRAGNRKDWRTYVLVRHESRSLLWRHHPDRIADRDPFFLDPNDARPRWIGTNGKSEKHMWTNADSLWVRADWLAALCSQVNDAPHGVVLLARAAAQALILTGEWR